MEGETNQESTDHSYVSDNLLLTIRGGREVFISTHGTFYLGSLPELMSFLNNHAPKINTTKNNNGTNNISN
jgi:hypothetical protein